MLSARTKRCPNILTHTGQCPGQNRALFVALDLCPCGTERSQLSPGGRHVWFGCRGDCSKNHILLPRWSWRPRCPLPPTSYGLRPHAPLRKLLTWLLKVTACCPYRTIPLGDRRPSEWLPRQRPRIAVPENQAFLTHRGSHTAGLALRDSVCCWLSHQFAHQGPHWLIGSHGALGQGGDQI